MAADLAARAAAVRQRRDDMAATQEAAIHARQQLVQQNLQAGQQLKVTHLSWLEVQPHMTLSSMSDNTQNTPEACAMNAYACWAILQVKSACKHQADDGWLQIL